jgi:hypothetical protein
LGAFVEEMTRITALTAFVLDTPQRKNLPKYPKSVLCPEPVMHWSEGLSLPDRQLD